MIEATSCGGVVIHRGKILALYKSYKNRYEGWVLPKGTVEPGEEYKDTAAREVLEETGVAANIIKYVGKSQYTFTIPDNTVEKSVHWYLMMADSYYSKPQREVRKLSVDVGIPTKLEAIKEEDLDFLAESAHADACAPGNPKDASVEDLKDLFRKIM